MVLTTAGAILLARRDRHLLAGLVLALGTFCRHLTLIAGTGLLTAQLRQRPTPKQFLLNPRVLTLALPWLAPVAFGAFLMKRYGDPLAASARARAVGRRGVVLRVACARGGVL